MSLDDELRRRLKAAADQAGGGANPTAIAQTVVSKAATGARPSLRLIGGLGVAGVVVGSVIGFTALKPAETAGATAVIVNAQRYSLYDCPDGGLRGTALPGDRVYVTGRNEAGDWLQLRDPRNQSNRAWVPADAVDPDAVADVPVVTCNPIVELIASAATATTTTMKVVEAPTTELETTTSVATTTVPATIPVTTRPTVTTKPTVPVTAPATVPATIAPTVPPTIPPTVPPTAPPTLPPDAQKPTVSQATSSATEVIETPSCKRLTATITVSAADNIGVTSVRGTWAGVTGSPKEFTKGAGTTWTLTFGPFTGLAVNFSQLVQISIVARDAAGNQSAAATVSITVLRDCLI